MNCDVRLSRTRRCRRCVIRDCATAYDNSVSAFSFPVYDEKRLAAFLEFADDPTLKKQSKKGIGDLKICENHFEPYFLIRHQRCTRLSNAAVPTLNRPTALADSHLSTSSSCDHDTLSHLKIEPELTSTGGSSEASSVDLIFTPSLQENEVVIPLKVSLTNKQEKYSASSKSVCDNSAYIKTLVLSRRPRVILEKTSEFTLSATRNKTCGSTIRQLDLVGTCSNNSTNEDEALSEPHSHGEEPKTSLGLSDASFTTCEHSNVPSVHRKLQLKKLKKRDSKLKMASSFKLYYNLVKIRKAYQLKKRTATALRQKIQQLKEISRRKLAKLQKRLVVMQKLLSPQNKTEGRKRNSDLLVVSTSGTTCGSTNCTQSFSEMNSLGIS